MEGESSGGKKAPIPPPPSSDPQGSHLWRCFSHFQEMERAPPFLLMAKVLIWKQLQNWLPCTVGKYNVDINVSVSESSTVATQWQSIDANGIVSLRRWVLWPKPFPLMRSLLLFLQHNAEDPKQQISCGFHPRNNWGESINALCTFYIEFQKKLHWV